MCEWLNGQIRRKEVNKQFKNGWKMEMKERKKEREDGWMDEWTINRTNK